jgi:hypothetical protein
MDEHGTDFDIIIDDGGHTMNQQITSLTHLWHAVKPGGVYFCEDLQTSYMREYGGNPDATLRKNTMMQFIYELMDDKMTDGTAHADLTSNMRNIDCMREVCAFTKKEAGTL